MATVQLLQPQAIAATQMMAASVLFSSATAAVKPSRKKAGRPKAVRRAQWIFWNPKNVMVRGGLASTDWQPLVCGSTFLFFRLPNANPSHNRHT